MTQPRPHLAWSCIKAVNSGEVVLTMRKGPGRRTHPTNLTFTTNTIIESYQVSGVAVANSDRQRVDELTP